MTEPNLAQGFMLNASIAILARTQTERRSYSTIEEAQGATARGIIAHFETTLPGGRMITVTEVRADLRPPEDMRALLDELEAIAGTGETG